MRIRTLAAFVVLYFLLSFTHNASSEDLHNLQIQMKVNSTHSVNTHQTTPNALGVDEVVLQPTKKMISEREAAIAACATDPDPEECVGEAEGEREGDPNLRDAAWYSRRVAGDPSVHFTMAEAAALRAKAAEQTAALKAQQANQPAVPNAYSGAWTAVGPNPMVLTSRGDATFHAMAGRIGALAVRSTAPFTIYLGGAQGGVWESAWVTQTTSDQWTPKTDQLGSLAIGAIALAPSNENIVYVGTGEGALSGDSYFGNGVLKSTDAGNTFFKVSADGYFTGVSISKIVVDKTNPNTLYVGTLRGRGGALRTSPPDAQAFGVYKSTDGGVNWTSTLIVEENVLKLSGVTDLAMDPQDSQIIYASILGSGISKTVNGGTTWTTMNLPAGNYAALPSRIALGIGRTTVGVSETVYAGFEYYDSNDNYQPSSIYKSTDNGNTWAKTLDTDNIVAGYCGTQCTYDNVIAVNPANSSIVYALGLYNYGTGSGGIFRSVDGGDNWVDLGFNLHPDYHAIAIRKDDPTKIVMGNDGGVWLTNSSGGRPNGSADLLNATDWVNLNGLVGPFNASVLVRTGLQLGQATSVATNPVVPNRFYEGTQDNGTQRKSNLSETWYDVASGDGGHVLVDPTDANYVYQTYYGLSPYRYTDGGGLYGGSYTSNESIFGGLNNDRTDFYTPWIMNPGNSEQLYIGTYRVYRTDNAKTEKSSDVLWNLISGDLTSGCTGAAANGARGCYVSAFGAPAESPALYVGTLEGWLWLSLDGASSSGLATWSRIDISGTTPLRPVSEIAVDRSDYRIAYAAFSGFSQATLSTPGHIFKTTDAGATWTRIDLDGSGFPDVPVNKLILDPSEPDMLYAGTDVGPYVTHDGGANWALLGTGFPIVSIEGMDLNPFTRQLVAATHGRGVWKLGDQVTQLPALEIGKNDDGLPVGPGSNLTYQITIKNYGNITATNVVITDPVPANTTFVAAGSGGSFDGTNVVFNLAEVAMPQAYTTDPSTGLGVGLAPGEATVTFTVQISTGLTTGDVITNDGYHLTSAEGASVSGSPHSKTLAPSYDMMLSPNYQWDGTQSGQAVTYLASVTNLGFGTDSYNVARTGDAAGFTTTLWDPTFTTLLTTTAPVAAGRNTTVGVKVAIGAAVANGSVSTVTLSATSVASPTLSDSVQMKTIAVTNTILLVDDAVGTSAITSTMIYQSALNAYGKLYNIAHLSQVPQLPQSYLKAHQVIVWYAGATYPGNLGPYESNLAAFLDNGGRLFMSGWDLLDQSGGTTPFVYDYLHINWDGSETQNDKGTGSTTAVISNLVTSGLGVLAYTNFITIRLSTLDYSDQLTPVAPAEPAFVDSGTGQTDGLTVDTGLYKVMFLAYPYEAINDTTRQTALMARVLDWLFIPQAPSSVNIAGSKTGLLNSSYAFTGTTSPLTTTTPINYVWRAMGQSPVIHTGNFVTDTVSFIWNTTGTKAITLTASNPGNAVTATYQITINSPIVINPISNLNIAGQPVSMLNATSLFTATTSPVTATTPITYVWRATNQSPITHTANRVTDTVSFTWGATGTKAITLTASNISNTQSATYQITIKAPTVINPISSLDITGPLTATLNSTSFFNATVNPITATLPVTYVWRALGQLPVTQVTGVSATVSFAWNTMGAKPITVTAANAGGAITTTRWITISSVAGDSYEPDNTCTQAKTIPTDGTVQAHTFHQQADPDWASFSAISGTTYVIQAHSTSSGADMVLQLYNACGGILNGSDDSAFGSDAHVLFIAPSSSTYYLKALNHSPGVYGPNVSYELSVRAQTPNAVILIVAGNNDSFELQNNILYATNLAYRTFLNAGIPKANIRYLSTINDIRTDADHDGFSDVYASSASLNVQAAITTWAVSKANAVTPFYLYMMDHGSIDKFLTYGNGDTITPDELDDWLSALEEATSTPVNVIYEACNSGSFIEGVKEISGPGRVIIASTGKVNNAYPSPGRGAYFSDAFFNALGQSEDLYTSFRAGTAAVQATGLWQTPWLDDDGNTFPNAGDGNLAHKRGLALFAFGSDRPPVIDSVLPPASIQNGTGVIRAEVRDDTGVQRVWMIVYPPSFVEPTPSADGTIPDLNLPPVELSDSNQDGEYVGLYENFNEDGWYRVVVYAEDDTGSQAAPVYIQIHTAWKVFLPAVLRSH
jgi:uncharacterized repeat protein (TIGR01451 family)